MAAIPTAEFSTAVTYPGGRHREPVATFVLFEALHQAWAWACWGVALMGWAKDHLDAVEDTALRSRFAFLPVLVLGGTIVVAVVGWVANS